MSGVTKLSFLLLKYRRINGEKQMKDHTITKTLLDFIHVPSYLIRVNNCNTFNKINLMIDLSTFVCYF